MIIYFVHLVFDEPDKYKYSDLFIVFVVDRVMEDQLVVSGLCVCVCVWMWMWM